MGTDRDRDDDDLTTIGDERLLDARTVGEQVAATAAIGVVTLAVALTLVANALPLVHSLTAALDAAMR